MLSQPLVDAKNISIYRGVFPDNAKNCFCFPIDKQSMMKR